MFSFHNINQPDVLVSGLEPVTQLDARTLRAKIVDSSKPGAVNIRYYIGNTRDKASGDFGRKPLKAHRAARRAGWKKLETDRFGRDLSWHGRVRRSRYAFAFTAVAKGRPGMLAVESRFFRS